MKNNLKNSILLIGFGNPGRLDDGLGPIFAEKFSEYKLQNVTIDSDYQLVIDDAADIAKHDIVVLVDAATNGREPFYFEKIVPESAMSFSSHSVSPPALLSMAHDLFDAETVGYLLGIRGYEFNEYCEKLSPKAISNMEEALVFLKQVVVESSFEESLIQ
ncbi:hydrogenase maturation protease [bacterium]|nr:hydrogenase maturation protease [bacterium]